MKLYNYWRSSASWRVRIALELKGVPYEYAPIHLLRDGGEQHGDEHRARNPMRQVPTLEFTENGVTRRLSQSVAILEFLEERFPAPALLPADVWLRARTRQLVETVNSGIQPLQNLEPMRYVRDELKGDASAWTRHFIHRGMTALEAAAKETSGRYLVGDAVTLADLCLVPQMYAARRFGVDPNEFPTLARVEAECAAHEAFQRAHAERQPDAVPAK